VRRALTEDEKYRAIEGGKPQLVDLHFDEAVGMAKRLAS
jgi:hypothetical protein